MDGRRGGGAVQAARDDVRRRAVIGPVARHDGTGQRNGSAAEVVDAAAISSGGVASDPAARDGHRPRARARARVAGVNGVVDAATVGGRLVAADLAAGERDRRSVLPEIIRAGRYLGDAAARAGRVLAEGGAGHRDVVVVVQATAGRRCPIVAERGTGHVGIPFVFHAAAHGSGVPGEGGVGRRHVVKVVDSAAAGGSGVPVEGVAGRGQDPHLRAVNVDGATQIGGVVGEGTAGYRHLDVL